MTDPLASKAAGSYMEVRPDSQNDVYATVVRTTDVAQEVFKQAGSEYLSILPSSSHASPPLTAKDKKNGYLDPNDLRVENERIYAAPRPDPTRHEVKYLDVSSASQALSPHDQASGYLEVHTLRNPSDGIYEDPNQLNKVPDYPNVDPENPQSQSLGRAGANTQASSEYSHLGRRDPANPPYFDPSASDSTAKGTASHVYSQVPSEEQGPNFPLRFNPLYEQGQFTINWRNNPAYEGAGSASPSAHPYEEIPDRAEPNYETVTDSRVEEGPGYLQVGAQPGSEIDPVPSSPGSSRRSSVSSTGSAPVPQPGPQREESVDGRLVAYRDPVTGEILPGKQITEHVASKASAVGLGVLGALSGGLLFLNKDYRKAMLEHWAGHHTSVISPHITQAEAERAARMVKESRTLYDNTGKGYDVGQQADVIGFVKTEYATRRDNFRQARGLGLYYLDKKNSRVIVVPEKNGNQPDFDKAKSFRITDSKTDEPILDGTKLEQAAYMLLALDVEISQTLDLAKAEKLKQLTTHDHTSKFLDDLTKKWVKLKGFRVSQPILQDRLEALKTKIADPANTNKEFDKAEKKRLQSFLNSLGKESQSLQGDAQTRFMDGELAYFTTKAIENNLSPRDRQAYEIQRDLAQKELLSVESARFKSWTIGDDNTFTIADGMQPTADSAVLNQNLNLTNANNLSLHEKGIVFERLESFIDYQLGAYNRASDDNKPPILQSIKQAQAIIQQVATSDGIPIPNQKALAKGAQLYVELQKIKPLMQEKAPLKYQELTQTSATLLALLSQYPLPDNLTEGVNNAKQALAGMFHYGDADESIQSACQKVLSQLQDPEYSPLTIDELNALATPQARYAQMMLAEYQETSYYTHLASMQLDSINALQVDDDDSKQDRQAFEKNFFPNIQQFSSQIALLQTIADNRTNPAQHALAGQALSRLLEIAPAAEDQPAPTLDWTEHEDACAHFKQMLADWEPTQIVIDPETKGVRLYSAGLQWNEKEKGFEYTTNFLKAGTGIELLQDSARKKNFWDETFNKVHSEKFAEMVKAGPAHQILAPSPPPEGTARGLSAMLGGD